MILLISFAISKSSENVCAFYVQKYYYEVLYTVLVINTAIIHVNNQKHTLNNNYVCNVPSHSIFSSDSADLSFFLEYILKPQIPKSPQKQILMKKKHKLLYRLQAQ